MSFQDDTHRLGKKFGWNDKPACHFSYWNVGIVSPPPTPGLDKVRFDENSMSNPPSNIVALVDLGRTFVDLSRSFVNFLSLICGSWSILVDFLSISVELCPSWSIFCRYPSFDLSRSWSIFCRFFVDLGRSFVDLCRTSLGVGGGLI